MKLFSRLWTEETGAIVSAEIMLVATILVIGVIVGLKSVRDSVVTELADVAQALANVNQTYSYSGTAGHHAYTAGSAFVDLADFCDNASLSDADNSKCVVICGAYISGSIASSERQL
jgi:Flp pilus assembly pilin Flp